MYIEGPFLWAQESHKSSQCVLTGCLTEVLIPQLKIAWVFYSMYVTGLGGAKPGQANAGDCSTAAETHRFFPTHSSLKLQLRQNPSAHNTHSETVAWTPG